MTSASASELLEGWLTCKERKGLAEDINGQAAYAQHVRTQVKLAPSNLQHMRIKAHFNLTAQNCVPSLAINMVCHVQS